MKKNLTKILIALVVIMGLFSFFKREKNDGLPQRFPSESFSLLEAKGENEEVVFITVNKGYSNYQFKDEFPWYLSIVVETKDKNKNGHPTGDEASVLNEMEDVIDAELKKTCTPHYIGRSTLNGSREIFYFVDDSERANLVMEKMV